MDFSRLAENEEIWSSLDFVPWEDGSARGFYRRVTIVKDGLLGEVARYLADDYVVLKYESDDVRRLEHEAKPEHELMTQRWLFVQNNGKNSSRRRTFWLGLKGGAEFYTYTLGTEAEKEICDLAYIVNAADGNSQKTETLLADC
ncbi:MAG: hypothetical protein Q4E34_02005 [Synergistaceae bacterium]|nr:hypothetical protein [Synergistaceae bacterium]